MDASNATNEVDGPRGRLTAATELGTEDTATTHAEEPAAAVLPRKSVEQEDATPRADSRGPAEEVPDNEGTRSRFDGPQQEVMPATTAGYSWRGDDPPGDTAAAAAAAVSTDSTVAYPAVAMEESLHTAGSKQTSPGIGKEVADQQPSGSSAVAPYGTVSDTTAAAHGEIAADDPQGAPWMHEAGDGGGERPASSVAGEQAGDDAAGPSVAVAPTDTPSALGQEMPSAPGEKVRSVNQGKANASCVHLFCVWSFTFFFL